MQKVSSKQTAIILGSLFITGLIIKMIVGTDNSISNTATGAPQPILAESKADAAANDQASKEYAVKVKSQLQVDLKSVDVHLADKGSLKWLFVTISLGEWQSLSSQSKKDLPTLLIRQMKTQFPNAGLKVSIGIDADQALAEADWTQTSNDPNIKIIGE